MKSKTRQFIVPATTRTGLICSVAALATLSGRNQAWAQVYDLGQTDLSLDAAAGGIATATATNADFGSTPSMGIDGNRDGNFSDGSVYYGNSPNSDGQSDPSGTYNYTINLGQNDYINRIDLFPRTDATQNVFGNFNISIYQGVGGVPAATPSFSENYNASYFGPEFATGDPGLTPGGTQGQFVVLTRLDNNYWLTFAEMEVVGSQTPLKTSLANDLALGKPVTVDAGDSGAFGSNLHSGNDGDINGDFSAPNQYNANVPGVQNTAAPVYFSNNHGTTNNVYWQVDLGGNTPLSYAELFARMGVNSTSEFEVEVYDSSMDLLSTTIVANSDVNGTTPGYDHMIDLTGITGEFVRVTPGPDAGDSYLSFSEVEVFAAVPEPSTFALGAIGLVGLMSRSAARRRPSAEN